MVAEIVVLGMDDERDGVDLDIIIVVRCGEVPSADEVVEGVDVAVVDWWVLCGERVV